MIALDAYAADCRVYGQVDIGESRMTDALNASPTLHIQDARLESLSNRRVVEVSELTVEYDELCAVVANGSRGDLERRLRTRATRVEIDLGPYHIEGSVHGTPASDPVIASFRRAAWLPLTDVTVTYTAGEDAQRDKITTLVVNRDLATLFRAIEEKSVLLPWETSRALVPSHQGSKTHSRVQGKTAIRHAQFAAHYRHPRWRCDHRRDDGALRLGRDSRTRDTDVIWRHVLVSSLRNSSSHFSSIASQWILVDWSARGAARG